MLVLVVFIGACPLRLVCQPTERCQVTCRSEFLFVVLITDSDVHGFWQTILADHQ